MMFNMKKFRKKSIILFKVKIKINKQKRGKIVKNPRSSDKLIGNLNRAKKQKIKKIKRILNVK